MALAVTVVTLHVVLLEMGWISSVVTITTSTATVTGSPVTVRVSRQWPLFQCKLAFHQHTKKNSDYYALTHGSVGDGFNSNSLNNPD
jgi:hypothetical protein